MKTIEGNKLIAEFMGSSFKTYKKGHIRKDTVTVCYFDDGMSPFSGGVSIENLKYHSSWDWLMPVVEKCLTISVESEEYEIHYAFIHNALWSINIKSVFDEVVEFIKWYNDQKK